MKLEKKRYRFVVSYGVSHGEQNLFSKKNPKILLTYSSDDILFLIDKNSSTYHFTKNRIATV